MFFQNSIFTVFTKELISELNTRPIRASRMNFKRSIDIGGQFWVKKNESGHTNLFSGGKYPKIDDSFPCEREIM